MFKPVRGNDENAPAKHGRKRRPLRRIGVLPTVLTLGNLCLGVGAVFMCCREFEDMGRGVRPDARLTWNSQVMEHLAPSYASIAVWMLVGAIICDALDGRVARKTNQMTKFGEQMDSLADMVSWGVAPAMIMMTMVRREIYEWHAYQPFGFDRFGQLAVLIGIIYVSCAALRLARFNVETSLEAASHEGFRGLPSPGAGGAVLTLVMLHDHLGANGSRLADFITHVLPFCTLGLGLLMVSNVPYRHMGSILLRRRKFSHFIVFLLLIPPSLLYVKEALTAFAWLFVISGLVTWAHAKLTGRQLQPAARVPADSPDPSLKKNAS
jgi:CDP-diacylglycerol---serine O-phosphatidyltransferase